MKFVDFCKMVRMEASALNIKKEAAELNLNGIDWVIVGGESGPGARPMQPEWAEDLRDQCLNAGVSFFFKQWGGVQKKKAGRLLEDRTWDEMPEIAL